MVTFSQIEDTIAHLHKEGKTTREISKVVHKNFTYIGAVLRKRFPEEYTDSCPMNSETQALKLFTEKRTPTQVAIELGSSTDETEKFYTNFWRLEGLYELLTSEKIFGEDSINITNLAEVQYTVKFPAGNPGRTSFGMQDFLDFKYEKLELAKTTKSPYLADLERRVNPYK